MLKKAYKDKNIKEHKNYDKGQIFVKIMAGFLAMLMIIATAGTLIYALMA